MPQHTIQCRKAELEMQLEKGKVTDRNENEILQNGAWLW